MQPPSPKLFDECPHPREYCPTCYARTADKRQCKFAQNKQALADWLADYIKALNRKQSYTVKDYGKLNKTGGRRS